LPSYELPFIVGTTTISVKWSCATIWICTAEKCYIYNTVIFDFEKY